MIEEVRGQQGRPLSLERMGRRSIEWVSGFGEINWGPNGWDGNQG